MKIMTNFSPFKIFPILLSLFFKIRCDTIFKVPFTFYPFQLFENYSLEISVIVFLYIFSWYNILYDRIAFFFFSSGRWNHTKSFRDRGPTSYFRLSHTLLKDFAHVFLTYIIFPSKMSYDLTCSKKRSTLVISITVFPHCISVSLSTRSFFASNSHHQYFYHFIKDESNKLWRMIKFKEKQKKKLETLEYSTSHDVLIYTRTKLSSDILLYFLQILISLYIQ